MVFFNQIAIFTFVSVTFVVYRATALTPQEIYWNDSLPNTPMPIALRDLIGSEGKIDNFNFLSQLKERKPKNLTTWVWYYYAAQAEQVRAYQGLDIFFLEHSLIKGKQMNLQFSQPIHKHLPFLPRKNIERVPFNLKRFPDILNHYSLKPDSLEANTMKHTIGDCESPGVQHEKKYCATSLEAMVDYCISELGKNIHALSTEVEKETPLQRYNITEVRRISGDVAVSCHKLLYVHPVFYCHNTGAIRLSMVSMVGEDGTKVKGVSICHIHSKNWNPKHLAFQLLKVKPGAVPICHFVFVSHVLWVKN